MANTTAQNYCTIDGDVLDSIIWKIYGVGASAMTAVMDANPHIRHADPHLPVGTLIYLPELPAARTTPQIRLWD